jgi:hypothetical protein
MKEGTLGKRPVGEKIAFVQGGERECGLQIHAKTYGRSGRYRPAIQEVSRLASQFRLKCIVQDDGSSKN